MNKPLYGICHLKPSPERVKLSKQSFFYLFQNDGFTAVQVERPESRIMKSEKAVRKSEMKDSI